MPRLKAPRPLVTKRSPEARAPSPSGDSMTGGPPRDVGNFAEIAKRHEDYLHRVAMRLSGNKEFAKDLVQETLARGLLHFHKFKQGTNARAWLVTILTRWYYDHVRHEEVIAKAGPSLVTSEIVASNVDIAFVGRRDADVEAAVQRLEPELRTVIEYCYMQGMSYKEIADKLQLPIGTVSTRLRRAIQRLKELLTTAGTTKP